MEIQGGQLIGQLIFRNVNHSALGRQGIVGLTDIDLIWL